MVLAVLLSGCGGDDGAGGEGADDAGSSGAEAPDEATVGCRTQWQDLADQAVSVREELAEGVDPDSSTPPPSVLTSRWTNIEATAGIYAETATPADCREPLRDQREASQALEEFVEELRPFDAALLLAEAEGDEALVAYERPGGRAGEDAPRVPQVRRALETMREQASAATADQDPGWRQAAVADLADEEARTQAVEDLELLSGESQAWQDVQGALQVLDRARDAVG